VTVKGTQNLTFRRGETLGTHFRQCKISNFTFFWLLQLQKPLQIFFQKILFHKLFKNNIGRGQIWNPALWENQKESFMDKDMLRENTSAYMVPGSQNAEWGRLFKGSHCWLRQITWTPVSDNGIGCWEYETQWGRTHYRYLKRIYCEKSLQYKQHWMSRVPQYQMASDISKVQNILSTAFGCQEYMFGKDSGIRKTEKVLQEPGIGTSFMSECWNSIWRPNVMRQDKWWQTMIQRNWEYGIQMNENSRLGQLCTTPNTTFTLWHRTSSSPMHAPPPPHLI